MFTIKANWNKNNPEEALLIGIWSDHKKLDGIPAELDAAFNGHITELLREGDLSASAKSVTKLHTFGIVGAKRLYFIGLGRRAAANYETIREAFGKAVQLLKREKREKAAIVLETFESDRLSCDKLAHAFAEAVVAGSYEFENYKERTNERDKKLTEITVYSSNSQTGAGLATGHAFGAGINTARDLINTPGNLMTPTDLARAAMEIAIKFGMEYEVLDREDMERLGMGALLAVSQGSDEPPKMITVKYKGRDTWDHVLALVGKGLTFDSGGYSIKPGANMHEMKSDMGGSGAVLGAMEAVGRLKPKTNLLFVVPSSENLINGKAMKPGDVFTSLSGKTIEVRNTDAEGRLILADAITYAKEMGADYLVDVATLTGGVVVALGDCTTGALTNNEELFGQVSRSAGSEGELIWLLPSHQPFKDMLRSSDMADLNNSTGRLGHAITGGLFVGEFAGKTPWVHLDIAGTAYSSKASSLGPKGATGVMVRTLARLALDFK
ncbi:leucyl aminopeptidase [Fictibacillus terranigra]|uniref:Probable cytosol aminopeptidase n=1 Tax=Fictibacillus terranigra TaxID=3058424 RepID=A0ABT8E389_9BACL|nr:leucyl aminopeptidase [Fictibacillus sp. CENA-BCM004]MDN4072380.1 leucyl aminopeptidase [Fictibacillus sp. CENA-BCM004]